MGENTQIAWCDDTFNPWWGCTKVSPGCDHCYAERDAKRFHPGLWGHDAGRRFFGPEHWMGPRQWNLKAIKEGRRRRVFCASMADVFDNHPDIETVDSRGHLWQLIRETQRLDWLILTKRIGNVEKMLPADWGDGYPNVWLGISVVNQDEADRDIPKLLRTPAAIRFLSCEPLLGPIDLGGHWAGACTYCGGGGEVAAGGPTTTFPEDDDGMQRCYECGGSGADIDNEGLDWVIVGGESGGRKQIRPMQSKWAIDIKREVDRMAGTMGTVKFFMKQLDGLQPNFRDLEAFPPELRVQEWPLTGEERTLARAKL